MKTDCKKFHKNYCSTRLNILFEKIQTLILSFLYQFSVRVAFHQVLMERIVNSITETLKIFSSFFSNRPLNQKYNILYLPQSTENKLMLSPQCQTFNQSFIVLLWAPIGLPLRHCCAGTRQEKCALTNREMIPRGFLSVFRIRISTDPQLFDFSGSGSSSNTIDKNEQTNLTTNFSKCPCTSKVRYVNIQNLLPALRNHKFKI